MLAVKDSSPLDLNYFKEKFNVKLSTDYNVPEIFFTLFEDNDIVGFSRIIIKNKKCHLDEMMLKKDFEYLDKNFFIRATASKVLDLGFEYLQYDDEKFKELLPKSPSYILDLLKGSCGDA